MGMRVLVVDDSAVMRSMVIRTIRLAGFDIDEILEAASGWEAIGTIVQEPVDLVLLDIHMPRMNGEEFLRAIRKKDEFRDLPVLVVTSDRQEARRERILALGADIIHKPFKAAELRDKVAALLAEATHA